MAGLANIFCNIFPRLGSLVLVLLVLAWPSLGVAAPKQVVVLLSEDAALYKDAANAIRDGLENEIASGKLALRILVAGDVGLAVASTQPDTLLVPLGAKAAQTAAQLNQPALAGLVARQSYEKFFIPNSGAQRRETSAIYLDQPLSRYVQLVRAVQPQAKTIGVLLGSTQMTLQPPLNSAAQASGMRMTSAIVNSNAELFATLQDVLPNIDVLLLLPDPMVVNRNSVQHLMLSAYRQHVPTLGYSQNLVEAGALAAVFSTPQQIGKQLAETILGMLPGKGWDLPSPAYPKYFSIKTNASVARSLDIAMPGDTTLTQRMGAGAGL